MAAPNMGVRGYSHRLRRWIPASWSGASTPSRRPLGAPTGRSDDDLQRSRPQGHGIPTRPGSSAAAARCGTAWPTTRTLDLVYVGAGNGSALEPRKRRSPAGGDNLFVSSISRRRRYRRIRLALPGRRPAIAGTTIRHPAHDPGRPDDRRRAAQGADAGVEERLLLCAGPRHRRAAPRPGTTCPSPGPPASITQHRAARSRTRRRPLRQAAAGLQIPSALRQATTGTPWPSAPRPASSIIPAQDRPRRLRRRTRASDTSTANGSACDGHQAPNFKLQRPPP